MVVAVVGMLMIVYVLVGGMKGTTWVQIIKAVLLIVGAGVMTVWVLAKYGFNLSELLGASVERATSDGVENAGALLDPGKAVRRHRPEEDRLHLALVGAGARHRRACRTC